MQEAVYKLIDPEKLVYNQGWGLLNGKGGYSSFKMFSYYIKTPLRYNRTKHIFTVNSDTSNKMKVIVKTPVKELAQTFIANNNGVKFLNGNRIKRIEVREHFTPKNSINGELLITTASPVLIKATDGDKTVCVPSNDKSFVNLLKSNLFKKYKALYNEDFKNTLVLRLAGDHKKVIVAVNFKGRTLFFDSYSGSYEVYTDNKRMSAIILGAGIGNLNASGFGCVKEVGSDF